MDEGIERISSSELSQRMKVTASQIRQDLNNFGGFGHQGYGYHVPTLYNEIGNLLGVNDHHNMIIIGAGNLGRALANYENFSKRGTSIIGVFDNDPSVIGSVTGKHQIKDIKGVEAFVKEHGVDIAAICIPKSAAGEVAKNLAGLGVRAFWNFSHMDLELPEEYIVENVHLSESLMQISYMIQDQDKKREKDK